MKERPMNLDESTSIMEVGDNMTLLMPDSNTSNDWEPYKTIITGDVRRAFSF
jgi:hypothetical protein